MGHGKVFCILCQRSQETTVTGPLSTKDSVTAHQNCLNSPEFDDLFGFSVEDVKEEVKRGTRLFCNKCKKRGATAGCEVKRCKKSYHYPCAIEEGAQNVEDDLAGNYGLYCLNHSDQAEKARGTICRHTSSSREPEKSIISTKAASPNVCCLTCQKTEEIFSFESSNNGTVKLTCEKHKPSPHQQKNSHAVAGPSYSSDSSSSVKSSSSKRPLSSNGKQEGTPSKRIAKEWNRVISDDSSDSDQDKDTADLEVFAPLESDIDESHSSNPEHQTVPQSIRNDADIPAASTSGNHSGSGDKEEDEALHSDAESESLLLPVMICFGSETSQTTGGSVEQNPGTCRGSIHGADPHTGGPSNPHGGSNGLADTPPCPGRAKPPCNSSAVSPTRAEKRDVPHPSSDSPPTSLLHAFTPPASVPSVPDPKLDCAIFWKCCNEAGCTQAIFSDFINEMSNISNRIQSDQATQEDYKLALKVMMASGKLTKMMAKQQEDLIKKQTELQNAAAAMKKVMSALK